MGLSIRAHVHYYATYYGYVYRVVRGDSVATARNTPKTGI